MAVGHEKEDQGAGAQGARRRGAGLGDPRARRGGRAGLWARRGERTSVPYTGSHRKAAPCAPTARDGRRHYGARDRLNSPTFLRHVRGLYKKFGRVAAVPGRAPQHRARAVTDLPEECGGEAVLLRLPVGTPEPSVAGALWHQLQRILAGMYFRDLGDFRRKVGDFLRTMPHSRDMLACLYRRLRRDTAAPRR